MVLLLDTNVLVYAVGREHPLRGPARAVLRAAAAERLSITTTPDVIQEFTHVYALSRPREEAVARALDFTQTCSPLVTSRETDIVPALDLFRRHERVDAFDCLLAAIAVREGVDGLVSADKAFRLLPGLPWLDLAQLDVDRLAAEQ